MPRKRAYLSVVFLIAVIFSIISLVSIPAYYDLYCDDNEVNYELRLKPLPRVGRQSSGAEWTALRATVAIYSAYQANETLFVVGVIGEKSQNEFFCDIKFSDSENKSFMSESAEYEKMSDTWHYEYSAVIFVCKLRDGFDGARKERKERKVRLVSIRALGEKAGTSFIRVAPPETSAERMIVCVRPFYGHYPEVSALLQFIAFYRINGVDRFIFYNHSLANAEVGNLIESLPFATLVDFGLPIGADEIHAYGQMAANQDCLLRNLFKTIIYVDVDEFIVTKAERSLKSYVEKKRGDSELAAVIVPNMFVCNQYEPVRPKFPRILHKTKRQTFKWWEGARSKIILLNPRQVIPGRLGIHLIWGFRHPYYSRYDEHELVMFHFRSCCSVWQKYDNLFGIELYFRTRYDQVIHDNAMLKYEESVLQFLSNYTYF